jgi:putative ABC transport system permease protein
LYSLVFRILLRLYPKSFRTMHGEDILATLEDRLTERGSRGGLAVSLHALRELAVLIRSLPGERAREADRRRRNRRLSSDRESLIHSTLQDLRHAGRGFWRAPVYTAVIVLTLALGIGANTAIFSVVNEVLLSGVPYHDPDRLVLIWNRFDSLENERNWVHDLQVRDLRDQATVFEGIAAMQMVSGRILGGDRPIHTDVARVSSSFFELLGVEPLLGRTFREGEDVWASPWVVLITHEYWTREFAQDPDIVGKKIRVGWPMMEIIGVLPRDFDYRMYETPDHRVRPELWIPHQIDYGWWERAIPGNGVAVLARLREGVPDTQARQDLERVAGAQDRRFFDSAGLRFDMVPLETDLVKDVRPAILLLVGAVAFVLLIAMANIATLVLARTQVRQGELAIRHSLGASSARVMRQVLTENIALALAGGLLGLEFALLGTRLLVELAPVELPWLADIGVDVRVLAFTLVLTVVTGLISGLAPAWQARRVDPVRALKELGRPGSETRRVRRLRGALITLQFALSLVLVAGAGLLIRSFNRLVDVDPGFRPENTLTFSVYLMEEYEDTSKSNAFYAELLEHLRELPEVAAVGGASALPLSAPAYGPIFRTEPAFQVNLFLLPGHGLEPEPLLRDRDAWVLSDLNAALPGYFEAAGISLVDGREFTDADGAGAVPVVVVDEQLAGTLWPGEDAVGREVWALDGWRTVVGVARHTHHHAYGRVGRPQLYFPHAQVRSGRVSMVVRTTGDPASLVQAIRQRVDRVDPQVPIGDIRPLDELVQEAFAQPRFLMTLMSIFAAAAALLAAVGIYGILSFAVSRRRREIAVRMSIGARPRDVAWQVIGQGVGLAAAGSVLGLVAVLAMGRLMESLIYGIQPYDPFTLVAAALGVLGLALTACWIPARRAASVDPLSVLTSD